MGIDSQRARGRSRALLGKGLEAKEGEKKMEEKKMVNCQLLGLRRWRAARALTEPVGHERCKGMDRTGVMLGG